MQLSLSYDIKKQKYVFRFQRGIIITRFCIYIPDNIYSLMQSPCLCAITSHTLAPCLEPGPRPADVSRNLSNYPVDDLWCDSGIISRTCYSPMAMKCHLMQFCVPKALPFIGLPFHFAISSFSMEIGRCSEDLRKLNLSCLSPCSYTLLKLSWHWYHPEMFLFLRCWF